ncbi:MAG: hypothetical protein HZB51_24175 [Chloroflexi bacterium]|nr:hypothetical protein [Chloroflexota bacterium]
MTTTIDQLTVLAKTLVDAATHAPRKLTLRVLGGVAVVLTCPSIETKPSLQRSIKDLDFVAPLEEWDAIAEIFRANGASLKSKQADRMVFDKDGIEIELTTPDFTADYRVDLKPRLALASPTLSPSDLLLIKLLRRKFEEKDIQDAVALLLDHRVAKGEVQDQIDHEYIAKLCRNQWALFHTVYDNTVTLEKVLDKYVEPEEAQLVWRRIELIQEDMDQQPKSFGWMINQFLKKPTQVPR